MCCVMKFDRLFPILFFIDFLWVWLLLLMSQRLSWRMSASSLNKKLRDVEYLYSWSITSRHSYHHNIKKKKKSIEIKFFLILSYFPLYSRCFVAFCFWNSLFFWPEHVLIYMPAHFLKTNVHHLIINEILKKKWRPRLFVFARLAQHSTGYSCWFDNRVIQSDEKIKENNNNMMGREKKKFE